MTICLKVQMMKKTNSTACVTIMLAPQEKAEQYIQVWPDMNGAHFYMAL